MANARGVVELSASGTTWRMRATWGVLADLQADWQCKSAADVALYFAENATSAKMLVQAVHRLLQGGGHEIDFEAARHIDWDEPLKLPERVVDAFMASGFWTAAAPNSEGERPLDRTKTMPRNGRRG